MHRLRTRTGFGSSCGACKFLRRKCTVDCVFSPYFSYDHASTHFAAVHKVFGASNVSRLLQNLPVQNRSDAAITVSYEALARMQDPVYGCVSHIFALQQQVAGLQEEIDNLGNLMANSTAGVASCSSSYQPPTSRNSNGREFSWEQDQKSIEFYQNQLANLVSQQGSVSDYQGMESHVNTEFPNAFQLEDQLFEDSDPNPFEKLLLGIDQEVFMNHPWPYVQP
ncbi:LOB domain-containing protein 33 [Senna tora]|uniref:LOB domain-containing protein 33 n=1 Tax=Senna tora TaxID=362788 RepID=A0A834WQJ9_9FABA|nr:LOB domain-containing protein 33 [Senna tora]